MAREKLSPEEAERRNRECRKRYAEEHRVEIREKQRLARMADPEAYKAKKRERYQANIAKLVEAGLLVKLPPGRKRLYTPEEALEVAKRQRQESYRRYKERIDAAAALLVQAE